MKQIQKQLSLHIKWYTNVALISLWNRIVFALYCILSVL